MHVGNEGWTMGSDPLDELLLLNDDDVNVGSDRKVLEYYVLVKPQTSQRGKGSLCYA